MNDTSVCAARCLEEYGNPCEPFSRCRDDYVRFDLGTGMLGWRLAPYCGGGWTDTV